MRSATLTTFMFVVMGYAANAQKFTILPQAGFENSLTRISYNDLSYFSPLEAQLAPRLGVRVDYKLKQGHGPFIGLSTSRSVVAFNFSNPETGMNIYQASRGTTRLQFEGGWQLSTKPIYFNKSPAAKKSATSENKKTEYKKSCGDYIAKSHCGKKEDNKAYTARSHCGKKEENKTYAAKKSSNQNWFVRIQPSVGMAFIPSNQPNVISKTQGSQTLNTYNAGNVKTAVLTGAGFEIGNNARRHFTLSVNYFKGLGGDESSITTQSGTKTTTTTLRSKVSGWNATIGIPISLAKKPVTKQPTIRVVEKQKEVKKSDCQQYRIRCRKII